MMAVANGAVIRRSCPITDQADAQCPIAACGSNPPVCKAGKLQNISRSNSKPKLDEVGECDSDQTRDEYLVRCTEAVVNRFKERRI